MEDEKELTHIDLFSGIGGFTLAAEWAGFKTGVFCEKEIICQKVLRKHWSGIPIIKEIRDFDGAKYTGATVLTGGFPCQPFSVAGQRRGKEDDRYLWPEMLRVINEAKPHWILAENVPGIFRMALDTVLADLEGQGYTTGTFIIPACGLNAPHRRNRIWMVANSRCQHGERTENKGKFKRPIFEKENASLPERPIKNDEFRDVANSRKQKRNRLSDIGGQKMAKIGRTNQDAQNAIGARTRNQDGKIDDQNRRISQDRRENLRQKNGTIGTGGFTSTDKYAPDSFNNGYSERYQKARREVDEGKQGGMCKSSRESWDIPWLKIATRFCRVDDGVSDRIHRLKALGNAIVPQIAFEIMKNIAWIEKQNNS